MCKTIRRQITRDPLDEPSESSIDQAASYENDVKNLLSELPPIYRLNMDLDVSQPLEGDPILHVQRSALVIIANRVVIKLYLPFMKDISESSLAKTSHQAVLGAITAAHSIIYASRIMYSAWRDVRPGIFEYYDFGRSLFDAAVICAQAVIQQPANVLAGEGIRGVAHALEMLRKINTADKMGEAIKIVEMMKEKAERARTNAGSDGIMAGNKRKRSFEEDTPCLSTLTCGFQLPYVGPSVSSVKYATARPPLPLAKIASTSAVRSSSPADARTLKPCAKDKGKEKEQAKPDEKKDAPAAGSSLDSISYILVLKASNRFCAENEPLWYVWHRCHCYIYREKRWHK